MKMHTTSVKERHWLQDGGFIMSSLSQNLYKRFFSLLPPDFPPGDKKGAAMRIVDMFQSQIKQNGSDARIKIYGDIPFASPWWSWLFK
jgi:hypothetical protein